MRKPKYMRRIVSTDWETVNQIRKHIGRVNDRKMFGEPIGYWILAEANATPTGKRGKALLKLKFSPVPEPMAMYGYDRTIRLDMYGSSNLKKVAYIGGGA